MKKGLFLVALVLLAVTCASASAPTPGSAVVSTPHATVTLISEQARVVPGQTLWLGLRFELIPNWHVYWRNPGASGTAPTIHWTLPAGWSAGEIEWPVPERIPTGPLVNYGYTDSVTLLVPIRIPEEVLPAGPLTITADSEWLVCYEECIPEEGRFRIDLNHPDGETAVAGDTREIFARARAQWPEAKVLAGRYRLDGNNLDVFVDITDPIADNPGDVWFAANQWGPVDASGEQRWEQTVAGLDLDVPSGDLPPAADANLEGLLVIESGYGGGMQRRGFPVRLAAQAPVLDDAKPGFFTAVVLALLGGLTLNLMPCVLPVLGIKILGFVRHAGSVRRRLVSHGLSYTAGVLACFMLLATGLLVLRAGGESLGWGFQLQSPILVTLLAYLMLLVGLNLSGVFSFSGISLGGTEHTATASSGPVKTFATGVLAAVVASPCTAPFMGAALGYAITRPVTEALAIFLALGAGFALPVLVLSLVPAWIRFIPKPGPWMKRLQQILAFPMFATAAWLLWILSQQTGARIYGAALAGLVLVAFAAWLYGQWNPRGWRLGLVVAGLSAAIALAIGPMLGTDSPGNSRTLGEGRPWSEQEVRELTAAGRPVFVNFTAAWCITCKVNEQVALSGEGIRRLFEERSIAYLVADWTRRDPAITRQLERYGRSGVPLYLLFSPTADHPVILPQLLTRGMIVDAINKL